MTVMRQRGFLTPKERAQWLIQIALGRGLPSRPGQRLSRKVEKEAREFAWRPRYGEDPEETRKAIPGELMWVRLLFRDLRKEEGSPEITLSGWSVSLWTHQGRLFIDGEMADSPWGDAFRWRVYETLKAMNGRLRFCRRATCGRPFLARKRQGYCQSKCALTASERNRAYWRKSREEINRRRRTRYKTMRQRAHGGPLKIQVRHRRTA